MSTKILLKPTRLAGVVEIEPRIFEDDRGFFFESWNRRDFEQAGLRLRFVQDNHSRSTRGTLRGLHYQIPRAQGKLVRVTAGRVFDVAVDLRARSPELGRWVGVWLSADKRNMLWIPPGFAHGFYVESPEADLLYKCTEFYHPEDDRTIRWDDPDLGIDWPLHDNTSPLLSEKDAAGSMLAEADLYP